MSHQFSKERLTAILAVDGDRYMPLSIKRGKKELEISKTLDIDQTTFHTFVEVPQIKFRKVKRAR